MLLTLIKLQNTSLFINFWWDSWRTHSRSFWPSVAEHLLGTRPKLPFTDEIHARAGRSSWCIGATTQHEHSKVIHLQQQPATPGHQPRELRSSVLRRLYWSRVQSARNLQSIILLIKLSITKNKTAFALGRACCQLIANCCVTKWNWDVNTSLRCIPYSRAESASCSNSGKLHFIMFVYSNIHFTNCLLVLHPICTWAKHHPQSQCEHVFRMFRLCDFKRCVDQTR